MAIDTPTGDYGEVILKQPKVLDFADNTKAQEVDYTSQLNTQSFTKDFDATFEKYRDNIPLNYLKALAFKASGLNPNKGLFGVSEAALKAFNSKVKETHEIKELSDPVLNTRVAVYVLKNVIDYYSSHYPAKMTQDWSNRDYVKLVTHGYNIGYKEAGLGKPMAMLYKTNPDKLTFDNIVTAAKAMKANDAIYNTSFIKFSNSVADYYFGLPTETRYKEEDLSIPVSSKKQGGGLLVAALVGIPFLAFLGMKKK